MTVAGGIVVFQFVGTVAIALFNYWLGRRHGFAEGRLQPRRDQTVDGRPEGQA